MSYYTNLTEWKDDMDKFAKNPNDSVFLESIKSKVSNSEHEIRKQIKDFTISELFKTDPLRAMYWIAEENPDKMLFIKSKSQPFFEV